MRLRDKERLLKKVERMANALGYDVGRLSSLDRDAPLAHEFSNAVDSLRLFQRKLAIDISARKEAELSPVSCGRQGGNCVCTSVAECFVARENNKLA